MSMMRGMDKGQGMMGGSGDMRSHMKMMQTMLEQMLANQKERMTTDQKKASP